MSNETAGFGEEIKEKLTISNPVEAVVSGELRYLPVARKKILDLHLRDDFVGIKYSTEKDVTLSFENKECTVDKWGRVIWK